MTNELPLSFFIGMVGAQLFLLLYALTVKKTEFYANIIAGFISSVLGFINSNMILNQNVVLVQTDGTTYSYIPIQSMPVHYTLLGLAIITLIISAGMVLKMMQEHLEKEQAFSAFNRGL